MFIYSMVPLNGNKGKHDCISIVVNQCSMFKVVKAYFLNQIQDLRLGS